MASGRGRCARFCRHLLACLAASGLIDALNVYTIGYTFPMLIETLSVREAREQLPTVLERFRSGDRTPVGVGSHRKTEAVMVPVEVFDELTAERSRALAQATASVRAEGLAVGV